MTGEGKIIRVRDEGEDVERDADFSVLGADGYPLEQHSEALESRGSGSLDAHAYDGSSDQDNAEIARLKAEVEEYKDRHLRTLAEFENYKKRTTKERSELLKYQGREILADLLGVLDNLELALANSGNDFEKLRTGLEMIHRQFISTLERWNVRGESGMGKLFDPNLYAAISRVEDSSNPAGTIVGELKKVYFYKDIVLRVGEVVVAEEADDGSQQLEQ